jgi:hypothetical protein
MLFFGFKRLHLLKQVGWFSFDPEVHIEKEQMCCYLTRTTKETHQIISDNLDETPTYGGWVEAKGPRYCPSIEDKVYRTSDIFVFLLVSPCFLSCTDQTCKYLAKNEVLYTDFLTISNITRFFVSDC